MSWFTVLMSRFTVFMLGFTALNELALPSSHCNLAGKSLSSHGHPTSGKAHPSAEFVAILGTRELLEKCRLLPLPNHARRAQLRVVRMKSEAAVDALVTDS